jgi:hypothetical protein
LPAVHQQTPAELQIVENNVQPGNILFVRGKGLISKLILAAEGAEDDKSAPTHVAIVVGRDPALVADCISPRIVIQPLAESLKGVESASISSVPSHKLIE